jgi:hypothetical protein
VGRLDERGEDGHPRVLAAHADAVPIDPRVA